MKPIRIFLTGGTIDKVYDMHLGELSYNKSSIHKIIETSRLTIPFTIETIFFKDSLHLNFADRVLIRSLCANCIEDTVIVVHGTDTMTETARALETIKNKNIILTGSIIPASVVDSDAIFNISTAIAYSQILSNGVYVVMNGTAFNSDNVRKNIKSQTFENIYS